MNAWAPDWNDPALRDEIPPCWIGAARGSLAVFRFGKKTRPWNWIELSPSDADRLWGLLSGFVDYFNARYAEQPDQEIPPCWAEHGCLVEEITTLRWARWHAFESPEGSIGGAQFWHTYTLPGFLERMRRWLGDELMSCQQGRHRDRSRQQVATADGWAARTQAIAWIDCERRDSPSSCREELGSSLSDPTSGDDGES